MVGQQEVAMMSGGYNDIDRDAKLEGMGSIPGHCSRISIRV